jgi:hypothetical protein
VLGCSEGVLPQLDSVPPSLGGGALPVSVVDEPVSVADEPVSPAGDPLSTVGVGVELLLHAAALKPATPAKKLPTRQANFETLITLCLSSLICVPRAPEPIRRAFNTQ